MAGVRSGDGIFSLDGWSGHGGHGEGGGEDSHDLGWGEHDEGVCGLERVGMGKRVKKRTLDIVGEEILE